MKKKIFTALACFAVIVALMACKQAGNESNTQDEKRITHHIKGDGFDHEFETRKGMKSSLSSVGTLVEKDGKDIYLERPCINISFASGYDFNVFHEGISIPKVYKEITDPDNSQTDFEVIEKGDDFLIYKAMEGERPFHSILVNVKVGDENFSAVTEQIHFDMNDKALVIGPEDCREVVKILRSIRKAK